MASIQFQMGSLDGLDIKLYVCYNVIMKKINARGLFIFILGCALFAASVAKADMLAPLSYQNLDTRQEFQDVLDNFGDKILATEDPEEMYRIVQNMIVLLEVAQKKGVETIIPKKHDELINHMWNSFLKYAKTYQQDEPLLKKLVALDPDTYAAKADEDTFPFRVVYAKGRASRPPQGRKTDPVQSTSETVLVWSPRGEDPATGKEKLYKPQNERMFPILLNGRIYQWVPNIFPTIKSNSLLVAYQKEFSSEDWQRQFMTKEHLRNSLLIYSTFGNAVMALNTMGRGGASINDLHFHTIWLDNLPGSLKSPSAFAGDDRYAMEHSARDGATRQVKIGDALEVNSFYDEFMSGFVYSGEDMESVIDAVMLLIDSLHEKNIHYNVIYLNGKVYVFLITPLDREPTPENFEFFGYAEKLGLFMTLDEPQFERASTKEKIRTLMEELRYPLGEATVEGRDYPGFDEIVGDLFIAILESSKDKLEQATDTAPQTGDQSAVLSIAA